MDATANLHDLARNGDVQKLTVALVKQQDQINKKDKLGRTPLHMAAFAGQVDCLKLLITEGADVHLGAQDDMTALHFAAGKGHTEAVRTLLDAGVKPTRRTTKHGNTPLHVAAKAGHTSTVQLLLRRKGNPMQANGKGESAIDLAATPELKQLMEKAVADAQAALEAKQARKAAEAAEAQQDAGQHTDDQQPAGPQEQQQGPTQGPSSKSNRGHLRKHAADADTDAAGEQQEPQQQQGETNGAQPAKKQKVVINYDDE